MAEITICISDKALRIVGILLAAGVFVWVFSYLLASGTFTPKYQLLVYVPEVSGLGVGAKVRLDGPTVGSVAAMKLAEGSASPDRRIQLTLRIDSRYKDKIRTDSYASVKSEGLLGDRYVAIQRGFGGTVISPNGEIRFVPTRELTFKEFGKIVDCLKAEIKSTDSKTQVAPGTPSNSQP